MTNSSQSLSPLEEDLYRPLLSSDAQLHQNHPQTNFIQGEDLDTTAIQQRSIMKDSDPHYGKTSTDFVAEIDSLMRPTQTGYVSANPILERLLLSFGSNGTSRHLHDDVYTHSRDRTFALAYTVMMVLWLIVGILSTILVQPVPDENALPIPTLHSTIIQFIPEILKMVLLGVGVGCLWLFFVKCLARPVLYITALAIPLVLFGIMTKLLANAVSGRINGPEVLQVEYSGLIAISAIGLVAILLAAYFVSKQQRRIESTIVVVELADDILKSNPKIFALAFGFVIVYALFIGLWVVFYVHSTMLGSIIKDSDHRALRWIASMNGVRLILFHIFVLLWTTSVLHNIQKVTIAGIVGNWFFQRFFEDPVDATLPSLYCSLTTSLGSICFGALIMTGVQIANGVLWFVQRNHRSTSSRIFFIRWINVFIDFIAAFLSRIVETVHSLALIYVGLSEEGFLASCVAVRKLLRRNLIIGLNNAGMLRTLFSFSILSISLGVATSSLYLTMSDPRQTPYGYIVGLLTGVICYNTLRFFTGIVQTTIDSAFVCYLVNSDGDGGMLLDDGSGVGQKKVHDVFEKVSQW